MSPESFNKRLESASMVVGCVAVVLAIVGFVVAPSNVVSSVLPLIAGGAGLIAIQVAGGALVKALREQSEHEQQVMAKSRTELMSTTRQQKSLTERLEKLNLVSDLLKSIATSKDLNTLLGSILAKTMNFVGARSGFVALLKEEEGILEVANAVALHGEPVGSGKIRVGEGIVGIVAATNKSKLISPSVDNGGGELSHQARRRKDAPEQQTLMAVPLCISDRVIGVLTLEDSLDGEFREADLELLNIVGQEIALAIEKARLYQRMETMSITDGLSGLANRRYLDQRLQEDMRRSRRYHLPLALTMFDLDKFKTVNDTYGHAAGDALLRGFAEILKGNVRDTDLVARYGGEEFVIVAPDCTDQQARAVAERVRRVVETTEFAIPDGQKIRRTVSAGVAAVPLDAGDVEALIRASDAALYHAKDNGRNRVVLHQELFPEPVIDSAAEVQ